jgi:hypothetical protein
MERFNARVGSELRGDEQPGNLNNRFDGRIRLQGKNLQCLEFVTIRLEQWKLYDRCRGAAPKSRELANDSEWGRDLQFRRQSHRDLRQRIDLHTAVSGHRTLQRFDPGMGAEHFGHDESHDRYNGSDRRQ